MKWLTWIAMCVSAAPMALAERAKLPELAVPGALGVNIHFTDPKPGEMEMLAKAGFKWVRMDFSWGGTERKKGEYDFSAYERLLKALEPHGIRAIFILDYGNRLYDGGVSPNSDEGRAAMAKWAATAVTHFKGKGVVWEMWNEPNIFFWKPKPNVLDYAKLALTVGKAIRQSEPDELYVGAATSEIDLGFLETCFKAGLLEFWDAVSVHPYRQKDPETVCEEYRKLRLLIAQYAPKGKAIPILSGEWGYSGAWNKFEEERQGKYLPREFLVNLYNEVPISIWYDWHDDGVDPKEAEHHFGTVHNPYLKGQTPVYEAKAGYKAMEALTSQLGGFAFSKRIALESGDDYCFLFSRNDEVRLAVWTTKAAHDVNIPASTGKFKVTDYLGRAGADAEAKPEGLKIAVTDAPQYLVAVGSNELLRVAVAWPRTALDNGGTSYDWSNPLDRPIVIVDSEHKPWFIAAPHAALQHIEGQPFMGVSGSDRSPERRRDLFGIDIQGLGRIAQETVRYSTEPLIVSAYPPVGASFSVGVENPSGKAFDGVIRLLDRADLKPVDNPREIHLTAGQTRALVEFQLSAAAPASWSSGFVVEQFKEMRPVLKIPTARYRAVWPSSGDPAEALPFQMRAEGDAKIKSQQTVAIAQPPHPLPAGKTGPCLKITYDFDPGWKFIELKAASDAMRNIVGNPKSIGMWTYGDGSGNLIRLRFSDSIGQVFQPSGPALNWKGWKWITIPMNGVDAAHWGGAKDKADGQIHYPIKWDTLLLIDSAHRQKTAGEIFLTGMTSIE